MSDIKVASIPQVPARRIEDDHYPLGAGKHPMASVSTDNLSDKRYVSTNDKADLLDRILQEHKILLKIVTGYPDILNEFVCAVKGDANLPATRPTAP